MWDVLMNIHPSSIHHPQGASLQEAGTIFTSSGGRTEGTMAKRKQMPPPPLPGQPDGAPASACTSCPPSSKGPDALVPYTSSRGLLSPVPITKNPAGSRVAGSQGPGRLSGRWGSWAYQAGGGQCIDLAQALRRVSPGNLGSWPQAGLRKRGWPVRCSKTPPSSGVLASGE